MPNIKTAHKGHKQEERQGSQQKTLLEVFLLRVAGPSCTPRLQAKMTNVVAVYLYAGQGPLLITLNIHVRKADKDEKLDEGSLL